MSLFIRHILLAEDDRATAMLVKHQLESKGFQVDTARNGLEALKILSSKQIDLLITDVVMPEMDGVDLYGAVKNNPQTSQIPIIIVTDKAIFKESFSSLGVSNFVEKTTDISVLLTKIEQVEKEANQTKSYLKVLITSNKQHIIDSMNSALKSMKFLVSPALTSEDIINKSLVMVPHVLVIDVLFQDKASAYELIKALRCFSSLKNMKIITYVFFPDSLGIDVESVDAVKNAIKLCQEAGSDKYIGRFNQAFFLEKILE